MANWASTAYAVEGPKEILEKIEQAILHPDIQENSDELWEGNVLRALGIKWNDRKPDGTGDYLRGFLNGEEPWWDKDGTVLRFSAEEAWGATDFHEILERNIPDIKVFYIVEEEGEEVYATNDKEGKYFPDRYWVDTAVQGNFQSDYFIEESKIYDWLSKITNSAVKSEKDVKDFNTYYEDLGDDDDNFIRIHKFDIID